jgi:plasmid stabilization system protein ParE
MVQVIWRKAALKDLNNLLEQAYLEYGQHTLNSHIAKLEAIQKRMQQYPDSYPPEPLLRGLRRRYRGAHLLGRFEVIYYFAPKSQRVYVVRLWDMRRNPDMLVKGMK